MCSEYLWHLFETFNYGLIGSFFFVLLSDRMDIQVCFPLEYSADGACMAEKYAAKSTIMKLQFEEWMVIDI